MKYPSLSPWISFSSMSILLRVKITKPSFSLDLLVWSDFFLYLDFKVFLSLKVERLSFRQQKDGYIYSASLSFNGGVEVISM